MKKKRPSAQRFGNYELVERIGRGGMAEVWRARMTGPAGFVRPLVVKRILPELSDDARFAAMFLAEARMSAQLHHPNIVQVFELGLIGREYFLSMEHVAGRDLSCILQMLTRVGPQVGFAVIVAREVARALAYAHGLRQDDGQPLSIVHRDVSPSNIMVSYEGTTKLLDFGIAKAVMAADERTSSGMIKGKVGYMSVEQLDGAKVDERSDLFALGVVLHEALTLKRLFKGENDFQTMANVRRGVVPPPSQLNPDVPPELDRICQRMLAQDANARYATADEIAIDLDRVATTLDWRVERVRALMHELFSAAADGEGDALPSGLAGPLPEGTRSFGYTAEKKRRRRVAIAMAVVGVTMVALGGFELWKRHRVQHDVAPPIAAPANTAPAIQPPIVAPEIAAPMVGVPTTTHSGIDAGAGAKTKQPHRTKTRRPLSTETVGDHHLADPFR